MSPDDFAWPMLAIDFESSGIGKLTYPIEIGISRWKGPGHAEAETWHSLIAEDESWVRWGTWSDASYAIHGIERESLRSAPQASDVMAAANRFAKVGSLAFCDGGGHDSYWLQRLATAAGIAPSFLIGSIGHVASFLDPDQRSAIFGDESKSVAHRAADDAEQHIVDFAKAFGIEPPRFSRITG